MNAPCKDCPRRHPSCHSTGPDLPDYIKYANERKRINQIENKADVIAEKILESFDE